MLLMFSRLRRRISRGARRTGAVFADAVGSFMEEAAFRVMLAGAVLSGRTPVQVERRLWNRATEAPVLVDAFDWSDDRLIFTLLVWPSLESQPREAPYAHERRVREVKESFGKVCQDLAWCTRFETDRGLRWDADREVWIGSDGYAFDGERLRAYSREGKV